MARTQCTRKQSDRRNCPTISLMGRSAVPGPPETHANVAPRLACPARARRAFSVARAEGHQGPLQALVGRNCASRSASTGAGATSPLPSQANTTATTRQRRQQRKRPKALQFHLGLPFANGDVLAGYAAAMRDVPPRDSLRSPCEITTIASPAHRILGIRQQAARSARWSCGGSSRGP